jgi:hypothetical protein
VTVWLLELFSSPETQSSCEPGRVLSQGLLEIRPTFLFLEKKDNSKTVTSNQRFLKVLCLPTYHVQPYLMCSEHYMRKVTKLVRFLVVTLFRGKLFIISSVHETLHLSTEYPQRTLGLESG